MAVLTTQAINSQSKSSVNLKSVKFINHTSKIRANSEGVDEFLGSIVLNFIDSKSNVQISYSKIGDETAQETEERYNSDLESILKALAADNDEVIYIVPVIPEPEE